MEVEKVRSVMYRAMECKLEEVFENLDDIDWIEKLCTELRDRINGLTPRRLDLQESFTREFDVALIVQMELVNDGYLTFQSTCNNFQLPIYLILHIGV